MLPNWIRQHLKSIKILTIWVLRNKKKEEEQIAPFKTDLVAEHENKHLYCIFPSTSEQPPCVFLSYQNKSVWIQRCRQYIVMVLCVFDKTWKDIVHECSPSIKWKELEEGNGVPLFSFKPANYYFTHLTCTPLLCQPKTSNHTTKHSLSVFLVGWHLIAETGFQLPDTNLLYEDQLDSSLTHL